LEFTASLLVVQHKVGIQDSVNNNWQVRLLCPWAKHFDRIASTFELLGNGSNRWQLDKDQNNQFSNLWLRYEK